MAEAPRCARCGVTHWRFVKCEDAIDRAAVEIANAAERERRKVYPVWRHDLDREVRFAPNRDPKKVYPVWRDEHWGRKTSDGPKAA